MQESTQFFRALVERVDPSEVDIAAPMLQARLRGDGVDSHGPAASGFGVGELLITPAILSAFTSIAVIALPVVRALVEIVVPSIGAAADVSSIRDTMKKATEGEPEFAIENIPRMAKQLEAQLVEAGFGAERSSDVALTCVKAMLSDPAAASDLLGQLSNR